MAKMDERRKQQLEPIVEIKQESSEPRMGP